MKRLLCGILTLACALMAAAAEAPVKIGVVLPLTGNNSAYGQLCVSGALLFEHDLKIREAKGELKNHYKIIIEDDQLIPRVTAEVLNKLINIDHVQALVSTTGGSGSIINPRAEQAQIIHIGVTTDTRVAKGFYNFTHWTPPQAEAPLLANIIKRKGFKRVAIINQRHQGMMLMAECIKKELAKVGITPVFEAQFNPGERDFRVLLARMAEAKPDVFIPEGFTPEIGILMRQQKQMGINIETTNLEMFDFIDDKEISEGKTMVSGAAETPEYVAKLKVFLPNAKPNYSGYFYDSLRLIVDAFEKFPSGTNADRAGWIAQAKDYPSMVGDGKLTVDKQHIVWTKPDYYIMKNGEMQRTTLEAILKGK